MREAGPDVRTRYLVPGLAAMLFAVFIVLYVNGSPSYFLILNAIKAHPFSTPFLDTRFVTAQAECWQRGVDVYATNPCDPLGRLQDYSPLWLRLRFLARPDSWTPVFGLGVALVFFAALFAMPWRLPGGFDGAVSVLSVVSWSTAFAVERGNTDLLMFAAAVAFAHLLTRSAWARSAGYALVLGAGLLKFYPLVLLGLALRENRQRIWLVGGLCGAVLVAFFAGFHAELSRIGANMAAGNFGGMFGARTLPFGTVELWRLSRPADGGGGTMLVAWPMLVVMSVECLRQAAMRGRDPALRRMLEQVDARSRSLLLVGAVLCVGCFFAHQNIGYRAVLLLLAVPGLLELVRVAPEGPARVGYRLTCALVVVALWGGDAGRTMAGWLVVQLAWWWIVCVLLSIVISELGSSWSRREGQGSALDPPRDSRPLEP